jgi:hypothetical protein
MPMPAPLPPISAASVARRHRAAGAEKKLPPVDKLESRAIAATARCASRATAPGYHEGSPIGRPGDGAAVLDHPAARARRKLRPGHAGREARHRGRGRAVRRGRAEERRRRRAPSLAFRLNTGDLVVAGPDHPLRFEAGRGPHPYLEVRGGLDALVARPVYYELAELALAEGGEPPGLWSGGAFFAMEPGA